LGRGHGLLSFLLALSVHAADWPMWRYDASRTASSPEVLPSELHLEWERSALVDYVTGKRFTVQGGLG